MCSEGEPLRARYDSSEEEGGGGSPIQQSDRIKVRNGTYPQAAIYAEQYELVMTLRRPTIP